MRPIERGILKRSSGGLARLVLLLPKGEPERALLDETTWDGAKRSTHDFANSSAIAFGFVFLVLAVPVNEVLGLIPTVEAIPLGVRVALAVLFAAVAYVVTVYVIAFVYWMVVTPRSQRDEAREQARALQEALVAEPDDVRSRVREFLGQGRRYQALFGGTFSGYNAWIEGNLEVEGSKQSDVLKWLRDTRAYLEAHALEYAGYLEGLPSGDFPWPPGYPDFAFDEARTWVQQDVEGLARILREMG